MNTTKPSDELSVRTYRPSDRPQLEALWRRVFPNDPPRNEPAVMIERKLAFQPELLFVGELGGRIVGAVMAGYDGVRGWIYHLAVAPEFRRRGFATVLMHAAEERLRALGCPKINLQVRAANREVVAFYESLGYAVEDHVSMGRSLEENR
jgi:ribosomal protein S18 acetylase RimI-like enzyme